MLGNYLKISLRNFSKSKTYSIINILGLAAGLSGFIIILIYLNYELSFDKWDPELKKVYKVSLRSEADILPTTPAPLAFKDLSLFSSPLILFFLLGVTIFLCIFSGIYPAFILSKFKPAVILKGSFKSSNKGVLLRKTLVVTEMKQANKTSFKKSPDNITAILFAVAP